MIIPAAVLLLICTSAVSAFSIDSYVCDPSGSLAPGTPVTVSYNVSFKPGSTFPPSDDLVMTTDLADPTWKYIFILEGVRNARKPIFGQTLTVSGFELSYPDVDEKLQVTLSGTAPEVNASSSKKIIEVSEITNSGTIIESTRVTKTAPITVVTRTIPATRVIRTPPVPAEPAITTNETTDRRTGFLEQIIGRLKGLFGM